MTIWGTLFVFLLFPLSAYAKWTEFDIRTNEDGSMTVKATYRYKDKDYSIVSTKMTDSYLYADYNREKDEAYIPKYLIPHFFKQHNLARQHQRQLCHMYSLSCGEQHLGFLHVGRKKTIGIKVPEGWWEYKIEEEDEVLKLWESLGILRFLNGIKEIDKGNLERVEHRGLAQLMTVLNPSLKSEEKKIAIEIGYQFICRLAARGMTLLPEKKLNEEEEEKTTPHQVVVELFKDDPQVKLYEDSGFVKYRHPQRPLSVYSKDWLLCKKVDLK